MDSHEAKLKFLLHVTKHGLQAFDSGGAVAPGTVLAGPNQQPIATGMSNPNSGFMGSIAGALGLNNNFTAGAANIQAGTNAQQLNNSYQGVQSGLEQQQNLTNTLTPGAATGVAAQNQLAAQLQAQANGQGPNVAQNQLNQSTAQNVNQQAALMAGQRGASGNAGLLARQAAQQGAGIQQQAVGQAATLGAQQQLAAQQQLQNLAGTQVSQAGQGVGNLTNAQLAEQGQLQGANTAYNNAAVGMQSNVNNVNAQTAAGNQGMAGKLFGGLAQAAGSVAGLKFAGGGEVKDSSSNGSGGIDRMKNVGGGTVKGASGADITKPSTWFACGGNVGNYADGGPIVGNPLMQGQAVMPQQGFLVNYLNAPQETSGPNIQQPMGAPQQDGQGFGSQIMDGWNSGRKAKADKEAKVAADEQEFSDASVKEAMGGPIKQMNAKGGKVSADNKKEKAVKSGNSFANDKIPAMLSEGEIVLPRSVTEHPNAPQKAAEFVMAVLAKKHRGLK